MLAANAITILTLVASAAAYINNPAAVFPNWDEERGRSVFPRPSDRRHTELKKRSPYINNPAAVIPNWQGGGGFKNANSEVPRAPASKRYINNPAAVIPNWQGGGGFKNPGAVVPSAPTHKRHMYINNPAAVIPNWQGGGGLKIPNSDVPRAPANKRFINNPAAVIPNWQGGGGFKNPGAEVPHAPVHKRHMYINNPAAVIPNWQGGGGLKNPNADVPHAPANKRYINNPAAVIPSWPPHERSSGYFSDPGAVIPRQSIKPRTSVYGDLKLRELSFGAISRAFRRQAQCADATSECGDSPGTCCSDTDTCVIIDGEEGCCPIGQDCTSGGTLACEDPSQQLCQGLDFCCPYGYSCLISDIGERQCLGDDGRFSATPAAESASELPTTSSTAVSTSGTVSGSATPTSEESPSDSTTFTTTTSSFSVPSSSSPPTSTSTSSNSSYTFTPSPPPAPGTINSTILATDAEITYTGSWSDGTACSGTSRRTGTSGDRLSFQFVGTAIYADTVVGAGAGVFRVTVDGEAVEVDSGSESGLTTTELGCAFSWSQWGMRNVEHTVELEFVGSSSSLEFSKFIITRTGRGAGEGTGAAESNTGDTSGAVSSLASVGLKAFVVPGFVAFVMAALT